MKKEILARNENASAHTRYALIRAVSFAAVSFCHGGLGWPLDRIRRRFISLATSGKRDASGITGPTSLNPGHKPKVRVKRFTFKWAQAFT